MVYLRRDPEGRIASVSRQGDALHVESADPESEEVQAFLHGLGAEDRDLAQSDIDLVRVIEDVIDVLIDKRVIQFTDLPTPAQDKLLRRRNIRDAYRGLNLIDDDETL